MTECVPLTWRWMERGKNGSRVFCLHSNSDLFQDNGLSVKMIRSISSLLYLSWNGKAQSRELPDLTEQTDQSVWILDLQSAVHMIQLHDTVTGLEAGQMEKEVTFTEGRGYCKSLVYLNGWIQCFRPDSWFGISQSRQYLSWPVFKLLLFKRSENFQQVIAETHKSFETGQVRQQRLSDANRVLNLFVTFFYLWIWHY